MTASAKPSTYEIYLVGGAVRDALLGLDVVDRDWVVVGATADALSKAGYAPVGKDFPVFLHPKTNEEYALARTERKVAAGYKGFEIYADLTVTLEQDLSRRDLTINAIAQDNKGKLIDPHGGLKDISSKTLRHVSSAFSEDPVRILRVARFAARFAPLGFTVAPETMQLMQDMVVAGEANTLVSERVWQELKAALQCPKPSVFFEILRQCGALQVILPEIEALFGVPQKAEYHPEIDCGVHTLMVVDRARELSNDNAVLLAALLHDLGKAVTPTTDLPGHRMHEQRGVALVERVCKRYTVPKQERRLATLVCRDHLLMHTLAQLRPATVLKLLARIDAFRNPQRLTQFTLCCKADAQGRGGDFPQRPYPQETLLKTYFAAASSVDTGEVAAATADKQAIPDAIFAAREAAIAKQRVAQTG